MGRILNTPPTQTSNHLKANILSVASYILIEGSGKKAADVLVYFQNEFLPSCFRRLQHPVHCITNG
jgi:hypothetical protein